MNWRPSLIFLALGVPGCSATDRPPPTPPRIVIDGEFSDWPAPAPTGSPIATAGDAESWARMWATNDEYALLVRIDLPREISLQVGNSLELCLDTDDDPTTGEPLQGFGAELCWQFGRRHGRFITDAGSLEVTHEGIGLVTAPTVTGKSFEIAIARDAQPAAGRLLFAPGTDTIAIVLHDTERDLWLPAAGGGLGGGMRYVFTDSPRPPLEPIALERYSPDDIRFLSYNLNDHLTDTTRASALRRILAAVDPDVILLEEIRSVPDRVAADYLFALMDEKPAGWHVLKVGGERSLVVSPFPILQADWLGESGAVLLQLEGEGDEESGEIGATAGAARARSGSNQLLVIVLSTPCCNLQTERQEEIDGIMAYVRDAREPGGRIDVPPGTPIMMMGDANLVGLAQNRITLLTGDIVDRERYGPPFMPDWDDTPFSDLIPRHTHRPYTFTWHGSDFPPGRLDYVIYGASELEIGNRFVLYTPEMPPKALARYGLEAEDTDVVTDHLPVVADLVIGR